MYIHFVFGNETFCCLHGREIQYTQQFCLMSLTDFTVQNIISSFLFIADDYIVRNNNYFKGQCFLPPRRMDVILNLL